MQAMNRYSFVAVPLLTSLLLLAGCNRHPSQTAQALNAANQPAADHQQQEPSGDQSNNGSARANSAPTISNSEAATSPAVPAANGANDTPPAASNANSEAKPDAAVA